MAGAWAAVVVAATVSHPAVFAREPSADAILCPAMQFDVPDPAYTASRHARAGFRLALQLSFSFVAVLWLVFLANWALDAGPDWSGIHPREAAGLPGILFAPL